MAVAVEGTYGAYTVAPEVDTIDSAETVAGISVTVSGLEPDAEVDLDATHPDYTTAPSMSGSGVADAVGIALLPTTSSRSTAPAPPASSSP